MAGRQHNKKGEENMKKIAIVMITLLITAYCVSPALAKGKNIQFQMILPQDSKATGVKYKFVSKKGQSGEDLMVGKDVLFSNDDIDTIIITAKDENALSNFPLIDIRFKQEAALKLKELTTKNTKERLAIIVDKEIITAPFILFPLTRGRIQFSTWKIPTNEEAQKFVSALGFNPVFVEAKKK